MKNLHDLNSIDSQVFLLDEDDYMLILYNLSPFYLTIYLAIPNNAF